MATTLFEDKLSEFIGIAEKASHGYYISNGVYHQNLEKIDLDTFIIAVKTVREMFRVVNEKKQQLIIQENKIYSNEAFWNGLKRQQKRFEGIEKNQLDSKSNTNNVLEIVDEIRKDNQQVIAQLKKAVEFNLTLLPLLFFRIYENEEKVVFFDTLQSQLIDAYHLNNETHTKTDFNLYLEIANDDEILYWFRSKEEIASQNKEAKEKQLLEDKNLIKNEKQKAINEAKNQIAEAEALAKKTQEDALKLMAEMQKKYGLN